MQTADTIADQLVENAAHELANLVDQEDAIIAAATREARAKGWAAPKVAELERDIQPWVQDVHGHERMALLDIINDGGRAAVEGALADRIPAAAE